MPFVIYKTLRWDQCFSIQLTPLEPAFQSLKSLTLNGQQVTAMDIGSFDTEAFPLHTITPPSPQVMKALIQLFSSVGIPD